MILHILVESLAGNTTHSSTSSLDTELRDSDGSLDR